MDASSNSSAFVCGFGNVVHGNIAYPVLCKELSCDLDKMFFRICCCHESLCALFEFVAKLHINAQMCNEKKETF